MEGERMPPRHLHLRAAAEGGGGGLSQDGVHLGLGFNEGGGRASAPGWLWGFGEATPGWFQGSTRGTNRLRSLHLKSSD